MVNYPWIVDLAFIIDSASVVFQLYKINYINVNSYSRVSFIIFMLVQ